MDLDNLQQNMNTRVVFKEPRGMIRWLQLLFAIIAVATVCDYYSTIGIDITCPTNPPPTPNVTAAPAVVSSPAPPTAVTSPASASMVSQAPVGQATIIKATLTIQYPFNFADVSVNNTCPGHEYSYKHLSPLNGSPQFYVMTGFLSLFYAAASLVVYLLFSSTYDSLPLMPVADLIIAGILCLFWFIASSSFSSGVTLLKSTVSYQILKQTICPAVFESLPGAQCVPDPEFADWKSINVGLVSGFTSFLLWGFGMWFVYKETYFHTPRGPL